MTTAAWDAWVAKARTVRIEDECERRGIKLNGKKECCGPCPKCGGEDRFAINAQKQVFNCRGCGACGDTIALVQFLDGVDFTHACKTLTGEPPPNLNGAKRPAGSRKIVTAEYLYHNPDGTIAFAVERIEHQKAGGSFVMKDGKRKKTFRQKRPDPDRPGEWIWDVNGVPVIVYRLPEVIDTITHGAVICVIEGEACANALWKLGIAATTNAGGAGKWREEHRKHLAGTDVVLIPDNDDAGHRHMQDVGAALSGIAKRVRVLVLPDLPPKGDVVDWLNAGGTREAFDRLVDQAPDWKPSAAAEQNEKKAEAEAGEQQLLDELARMPRLDYEHRRKEAAGDLGMRAGALDAEVAERRARQQAETGPPPLFGHWIVEPWPEEVETDALLSGLKVRMKRYVIFSDAQATITALWVLFAWVHEIAAVHSPILRAISAEANSGKTTLLNLISFLVPRALLCVEISEATLFRGIELWQPTIIVDEADVILVNNEPLRAVINSGWTRGAVVPRCIGDEKTPHAFPTFCPKALGMKGNQLLDTTRSRCIDIELKRKRPSETVVHFRAIDDAGLQELRQQAQRWANDNAEGLKGAEPTMPEGFNNRLGDNFRLLFAIADLAGGEWPEKAREAAQVLSRVADVSSQSIRLLADIKTAFDAISTNAISSAALVGKLTAYPDAEWAEMGKSKKPLSQNQLARLLKRYGITPDNHVPAEGGGEVRGYHRKHFEESWERYLASQNPASQPSEPSESQ